MSEKTRRVFYLYEVQNLVVTYWVDCVIACENVVCETRIFTYYYDCLIVNETRCMSVGEVS